MLNILAGGLSAIALLGALRGLVVVAAGVILGGFLLEECGSADKSFPNCAVGLVDRVAGWGDRLVLLTHAAPEVRDAPLSVSATQTPTEPASSDPGVSANVAETRTPPETLENPLITDEARDSLNREIDALLQGKWGDLTGQSDDGNGGKQGEAPAKAETVKVETATERLKPNADRFAALRRLVEGK